VRGLIIGAIRQALAGSGIRAATTGASSMMDAFRAGGVQPAAAPAPHHWHSDRPSQPWTAARSPYRPDGFGEASQARFDHVSAPSAVVTLSPTEQPSADHPLGAARAQIGKNYIVAESGDSLILVDQHAAHERLVYEAFKNALKDRALPSQMLLIPDIVDLSADDAERIAIQALTFEKFGLIVERFGPGAVAVRATPAMLGQVDVPALIKDLADELEEQDAVDGLSLKIDAIASRMACHGSVRSGRILKPDEMNALLRQMEATPGSGTCNHGRPTFIELKLSDIERLFGRK
jgi:DNA mismatch repair protein MutL